MSRFATLLAVLLTALLPLLALPARAQGASFQGLGDLPGGFVQSAASGVSADGSVVVGGSNGASGTEAYRWTAAGGMVGLGDLPGGNFGSVANDVSADGAVVVGQGSRLSDGTFEAFRWTQAGGMVGLGDLPGGAVNSSALGVSSDGSVVAGNSNATHIEPFRWTQAGGMVGLGTLLGSDTGGRGVSGDGTVVVGDGRDFMAASHAFRWTQATGMVAIGDLPGGATHSLALDISADGNVIVGTSSSAASGASGLEAFRWTASGGMVGLGDLPGGLFISQANDASGDGAVVVGHSFTASGAAAFVWTAADGMRSLKDVLVAQGVNVTGWALTSALAVSADGSVIVGSGLNPQGQQEGWRAVVPGNAVFAPAAGVLVVAGSRTTIQYRLTGPTSVAIYYTADHPFDPDNVHLTPIASNTLNTGTYDWTVPDTLARFVRILVEDATDSDPGVYSDPFRVRRYHLVRFAADGNYEPFDVDEHGWSFANVEPDLFPPAWFGQTQFDYANGTDPFTGGAYDFTFPLPPINASPPVFADWPSYVRAFGTDDAYWTISFIGPVYNQLFKLAWAGYHGGQGWKGSCSGMAAAATAAFGHREAFGVAYPAIGSGEHLFDVPMSDGVREAVNQLFSYWPGRQQRARAAAGVMLTPRQTLAELKAMLLSDDRSTDPAYLYLSNDPANLNDGAHAVVPYRMQRVQGGASGEWWVYVYDPNLPGVFGRNARVFVDSTSNVWVYSPQNWTGSNRLYLMDAVTNYLAPATPARLLEPLDRDAIPAGGARRLDTLYVAATPGADVTLAGAGGAIGYAGGGTFNTLPGAYPDVPPVGGPTPPVGYFVPAGPYALTLSAFPAAAAATFFDGDRAYAYGRQDADAAHTDRLAYDPAVGMSARSDDAGVTKRLTLRALLTEPDHERVLDAADLALTGADSVRFAVVDDPSGPRLRLTNEGGDKTYTLRLREAGAGGAPAFLHVGVPLGAGAAHLVRPDWTALNDSTVAVDVDADGDGDPDGTLVLENHAPSGDLAVTLTPEAAPVVIAPGGGSFRFTYAVTNTSSEPVSFDAWTAAEGPVSRSPVVGPRAVTLPPGATASRTVRQRVPGAAPAGVYAYRGLAGTFPDSVTAGDAFAVTKEGVAGARGGETWPAAEWAGAWTVTAGAPVQTAVLEAPSQSALHAAYPNPFDGRTTLRYDVAEAGRVRIAVYDLLGREVAVLVNEEREAGRREAVLDGGRLAAGVYLVRMTTDGGFTQTQRVLLLR